MGIHTSVKAHINDKRLNLAVETDTVHEHEENETILVTEPQATDSVLETSMMSMASTSYWPSICDGNIPCLPMFSSAAKVH
ncbi:hypothetical protein M0R45_037360 [Rubus argutus]|uniref:Uncharacterized protein n=1 Tax=Rubus argutus TaxID=59490 RepID=A0AAW1VZX0_RUBAR